MRVKQAEGVWLHAALSRVARALVGIDHDAEGVALGVELGYECHQADCQDSQSISALNLPAAEVVIAGELIEHLDRPGDFLDAVKSLVEPTGQLVLTTPNALSLTNFLGALIGREFVNPDHVAWFSPQTITTLLARHGWGVRDILFYPFPSLRDSMAMGRISRGQAAVFRMYQAVARPLFRVFPWLADGLVISASAMPGVEKTG